jgi:hypothetical protein
MEISLAKAIELTGLLLAAAILPLTDARAAVTISSKPTAKMTCSGGVCSPTATNAVLNAGDLETLLASGNVTVTTTGAKAQANDIRVEAPFAWSSTSTLSLTAYQAIFIYQPISVTGIGGVSLAPGGDGGYRGRLVFADKGHISFQNLSSSVSVSGTPFTLVSSIASLANAVAANPAGTYALAADYDASQDGTYASAPVATGLTGTFEGLGNAISGLSISSRHDDSANVGLFAINEGGIHDIILKHAKISATGKNDNVGAVVGLNDGFINYSHSDAVVKGGEDSSLGGAVGNNMGALNDTSSSGKVSGHGNVGGLMGSNNSLVLESFSTADVTGGTNIGGLIGSNALPVQNSYATGNVTGDSTSVAVGGLIGADTGSNDMTAALSYSSGNVTGASGAFIGGFVGEDISGDTAYSYWDTTTSGISNPGQGAGNIPNDPGLDGLTTAQLQAGAAAYLPPQVWGLNPKINGGLPYLLFNPPSKK